jgi:RHS repeat-associated protein
MITEYDIFGRVTQTGWKQMTVSEATRKANQTSMNSGSSPFTLTVNDVLTKNYYDDYSYPGAPTLSTTLPNSTFPIAQNVKGLPTGSWVKVLDSNNPSAVETSYTFYDDKYRPVLTNTNNYLGGFTQVESNLDWAGKTLYTVTTHKYDTNATPIVITDTFGYSDQDRLTLHYQQIGTENPQLITSNIYDELGQLISKNVGGENVMGTTGLQKVDYSYNVRGWLKSINDIDDTATENDLFAFKISYNDPSNPSKALFNGNISETFWKTSSDNILRKYEYSYDNLNRLTNAIYIKETSVLNSYGESLTYDKNGNINTLNRNGGIEDPMYVYEIDALEYTYHPQNKNRLMMVADSSGFPEGFKDDADSNVAPDSTVDYDYDENGNMIKDENKGITHISYNHLNLPVEIIFNNNLNTKIEYIYNAVGQKLVKNVFSQYNDGTGGAEFKSSSSSMARLVNNIETTVYLSGFQYKNNILQFFPHAEGYVKLDYDGQYSYVYNYTDHLGNVRLSYADFDKNGVLGNEEVVVGGNTPLANPYIDYISPILEENHYYPFGLEHSGYYNENAQQSYKYKYNGKELQDELGLNVTAMDFRQYDPAIGRFNGMDRLAEFTHSITPYRFALNNPNYFNDPSGLTEEGGNQITDYYRDDNHNVFFDPNVHGPGDVPSGMTYIGPTYTDPNTGTFWDEGGQPHSDETQLNEVVVSRASNSSTDYHDLSMLLRKYSGYAMTIQRPLSVAFEQGTRYPSQLYIGHTSNVVYKTLGGRIQIPLGNYNTATIGKISKTLKIAGRTLGVLAAVSGGVSIYNDGLNISNGLDTSMALLALSPTGVGQAIAGSYFLLNTVSQLTTGKDIGQHIQEQIDGK